MSLIVHELDKLQRYLTKDTTKAINKAGRRAMTRGAAAMLKSGQQQIREEYKLKARDAKTHFKMIKKTSGRWDKHSATLMIADKKIDLIKFMVGTKKIAPQRGIKVSRRKKVRVQITPGKRSVIKTGFVQKSLRGSGLQIFKRKGDGWAKQAVPSPHFIFNQAKNRLPVIKAGVDAYNKTFKSALAFQLQRAGAK